MDVLRELRKEQDEQCARMGDKWQDYDRLLINAGVDVVAVSGDLGHSQVSTTTMSYVPRSTGKDEPGNRRRTYL